MALSWTSFEQEDPACGWCDDGSNRGTGTCLPGGWRGALHAAETCPVASRWYFTECPLCQCNGHSTCIEGSRGLCHQPCQDLTEGTRPRPRSTTATFGRMGAWTFLEMFETLNVWTWTGAHCETCISGYFGNPVNGGTCSPCQCSGHGTQCHQLTGRCFCTTKVRDTHRCNDGYTRFAMCHLTGAGSCQLWSD